eukprot:218902-Alexandrium_andersonii.AAC.1
MSASLVGSEMCIRDREDPDRGRAGHDLPALVDRHGDLKPPDALQGDPVSYTHLTLPTICSV